MNTARTLELSVKAAREFMAGNESLALQCAKTACLDADQIDENERVKFISAKICDYGDLDDFNKRMFYISLVVAAARDHKPNELDSLY